MSKLDRTSFFKLRITIELTFFIIVWIALLILSLIVIKVEIKPYNNGVDAYIIKNFVSPSKKYNIEIRDIKQVRIDLFYVGSKKHKIIFSDYEGKEYTVFPPLLSDYYSNRLLINQINDAIESGTNKTFTIWNTKALKYCLIWTIILLVYICFLKINNIIDFFTKAKPKQQRTQLPKSNKNTEKGKYNDINNSIIK